MSDDKPLRPISNPTETAQRAADSVRRVVKAVTPFGADAPVCDDCGATMEPSRTYDAREAAFYAETNGKVPSWECPECGRAIRRESDTQTPPNPFDPRD